MQCISEMVSYKVNYWSSIELLEIKKAIVGDWLMRLVEEFMHSFITWSNPQRIIQFLPDFFEKISYPNNAVDALPQQLVPGLGVHAPIQHLGREHTDFLIRWIDIINQQINHPVVREFVFQHRRQAVAVFRVHHRRHLPQRIPHLRRNERRTCPKILPDGFDSILKSKLPVYVALWFSLGSFARRISIRYGRLPLALPLHSDIIHILRCTFFHWFDSFDLVTHFEGFVWSLEKITWFSMATDVLSCLIWSNMAEVDKLWVIGPPWLFLLWKVAPRNVPSGFCFPCMPTVSLWLDWVSSPIPDAVPEKEDDVVLVEWLRAAHAARRLSPMLSSASKDALPALEEDTLWSASTFTSPFTSVEVIWDSLDWLFCRSAE